MPPGSYWVFVPAAAPDQARVLQRPLPDGTATSGWAAADVPSGGDATITITLVNLAP